MRGAGQPQAMRFKRQSLERGLTLVETVMAVAIAGAFLVGGLYLYGQAQTSSALNDTQKYLLKAISDVQAGNPEHWYAGMSAADMTFNLPDDGVTRYGRVEVGLKSADPGDAFRVFLKDIPIEDVTDFCEPLKTRMIHGDHVDGGACKSAGGKSALELRVRMDSNPTLVNLGSTP